MFKSGTLIATAIVGALAFAPVAFANPMVGGAPMMADMTIVQNASAAPNLTTLVAAVKAAGLVDTLSGKGPFTVLAPTNAAFAKIDKASLGMLLEPSQKQNLTKILTCHVIAGDVMSRDIAGMIAADGGVHSVTTVGGCVLKLSMQAGKVKIEDENGRTATVTIADVDQSNGVVHVIDTVLLPAGWAK